MIEAINPHTGQTRRARTLAGLARQVGGRGASFTISHSAAFEPTYREVRITRPARTGGHHVLSTWIVRGGW